MREGIRVSIWGILLLCISLFAIYSPVFSQSYPDLVVQNVRLSPMFGFDETTVDVTFDVRNQGSATAYAPFKVSVYWSIDPIIDTGDDVLADTIKSNNIPVGYYATFPMTVTLSSGLAQGQYYIGIIADVDGVVPENDKTNNSGYAVFQVIVGNRIGCRCSIRHVQLSVLRVFWSRDFRRGCLYHLRKLDRYRSRL